MKKIVGLCVAVVFAFAANVFANGEKAAPDAAPKTDAVPVVQTEAKVDSKVEKKAEKKARHSKAKKAEKTEAVAPVTTTTEVPPVK